MILAEVKLLKTFIIRLRVLLSQRPCRAWRPAWPPGTRASSCPRSAWWSPWPGSSWEQRIQPAGAWSGCRRRSRGWAPASSGPSSPPASQTPRHSWWRATRSPATWRGSYPAPPGRWSRGRGWGPQSQSRSETSGQYHLTSHVVTTHGCWLSTWKNLVDSFLRFILILTWFISLIFVIVCRPLRLRCHEPARNTQSAECFLITSQRTL